MKTGDPFANDTIVGPLVSETQFKRVTGYINIGEDEGARILTGGPQKAFNRGYYVRPTVFADVNNQMRIAQEEIFGPVATLIPFKDEHDAVLQGNDTVYGLAAGIWTRDISRAITVARKLKAGWSGSTATTAATWVRPLADTSNLAWAARAASIPFKATPKSSR